MYSYMYLCVFHCAHMHSAAVVCTRLIALFAFTCLAASCTCFLALTLSALSWLKVWSELLQCSAFVCFILTIMTHKARIAIWSRHAHFTHLYLWGKPLSSLLSLHLFPMLCLIFWRIYTKKCHRNNKGM